MPSRAFGVGAVWPWLAWLCFLRPQKLSRAVFTEQRNRKAPSPLYRNPLRIRTTKPAEILIDRRGQEQHLMVVAMSKRVALYLRVSTTEQTVENQQLELEAVAERLGWHVAAVFTDAGISGTKGREKRPGYDRLCHGIARREFNLVAAWSVDRLGRSLQNLVAFLGELHAKNVDLYLHRQGLDTSTPAGKAMFQMLGVFSEFERAMIVERVKASLARARAQGKRLGRRP